ncbi:hypothetical protein HDU98_003800 [Podochytrium sp. JEL0797]|nr:hypothetical protein HDU98_003800 [Podochytrium sp. JEL0797]
MDKPTSSDSKGASSTAVTAGTPSATSAPFPAQHTSFTAAAPTETKSASLTPEATSLTPARNKKEFVEEEDSSFNMASIFAAISAEQGKRSRKPSSSPKEETVANTPTTSKNTPAKKDEPKIPSPPSTGSNPPPTPEKMAQQIKDTEEHRRTQFEALRRIQMARFEAEREREASRGAQANLSTSSMSQEQTLRRNLAVAQRDHRAEVRELRENLEVAQRDHRAEVRQLRENLEVAQRDHRAEVRQFNQEHLTETDAVFRVLVEDARVWPDLKEYLAHSDKRLAFAMWAVDQNLATVVRELRYALGDAPQAVLSSHLNKKLEEVIDDDEAVKKLLPLLSTPEFKQAGKNFSKKRRSCIVEFAFEYELNRVKEMQEWCASSGGVLGDEFATLFEDKGVKVVQLQKQFSVLEVGDLLIWALDEELTTVNEEIALE